MKTKYRSSLIFLPLIYLLVCQQASAQNEGRWYDVEVIIFKRLDSSVLQEEFWPSDLKLAYPENVQYLFEKPEEIAAKTELPTETSIDSPATIPAQAAEPVSFQLLPKEKLQLTRYRNSLGSNRGYRVLFHRGWQQQMQGKDDAPSIVISGGGLVDDKQELQGYINLYIARYLHINTNLWLSHEEIAQAQNIDLAKYPINVPERPLSQYEKNNQLNRALAEDSVPFFSTEERVNEQLKSLSLDVLQGNFEVQNDIDEQISTAGVVVLKQHRRMRSKELHYIDHPLVGLIIYFNPIDK